MVQSLARGIEILSIIQERGSATIVEVASVRSCRLYPAERQEEQKEGNE